MSIMIDVALLLSLSESEVFTRHKTTGTVYWYALRGLQGFCTLKKDLTGKHCLSNCTSLNRDEFNCNVDIFNKNHISVWLTLIWIVFIYFISAKPEIVPKITHYCLNVFNSLIYLPSSSFRLLLIVYILYNP